MIFIFLLLTPLLSFAQLSSDRNIGADIITSKELPETPASPAAGYFKLYVKGGALYLLNSSSVETEIGTGAGGGIAQWLTGTNYQVDDLVIESNKIYICLVSHMAGVFATDLSGGNWQLVQNEAGAIVNVPSGNLAATNVQTALNELQSDIDGRQSALSDSAGLRGALSDETGTGSAVFSNSPNITTPTGIVKGDVGLGNVDNTSDATKNSAVAALTNKTIDADSNTITNIENADIKAAAAIDATKIADGSVTSAEFQRLDATSSIQTQLDSMVEKVADDSDTTGASFDKIRLPNDSVTSITGGAYIATGNKNILSNASFEHSTYDNSWTNSGTGTESAETSVIHDGLQSWESSLSSQTVNLVQSSTLYASNFADGVQCLASMRIKSNLSAGTLSLCAVQAGTVSTNDCVTVNNDNKWGLYSVSFLCGGTSNGISLAGSGLTGTVYADDAFVGAPAITGSQAAIGPWTTFTPTGSWSTNTTYAGKYRQVGQNLEINYRISTSGAPTTANLTVNLPSGFTIDVTKLASGAGANVLFPAIGVVNDSGTSFTEVSAYYSSTTALLLTIKGSAGTYVVDNNPITQAVPITFGAGDSVDVFVTVPIVELNGNITTYNAQCGANCVDVFSAAVGSTGTVTQENADWLNGNCTNGSTGNYSCTFNSNIFTVAPNCWAMPVNNPTTTNDSVNNNTHTVSSSGFSTTSKQGGTFVNVAHTVYCQKQGADFTATRLIQGTFKNMSQYPGINKPKTCVVAWGGGSATLASPTECTSGTCVETYDSCGTASPPSWTATGAYDNITWAAGTWANSTFVHCESQGYDVSTGNGRGGMMYFVTGDNTWTTSSSGGLVVNTVTSTPAGTTGDSYAYAICTGEAP